MAPTLEVNRTTAELPLRAEVVFLVAPAAVGKSTVAAMLSAASGAPLLNLSRVPVSTHSLVGLLSQDVTGPSDALQAFHAGQLPIVVDALDEGRLTSGDTGFDQFFETAAELMQSDRSVVDRPKLVLLGRNASAELAETWLEVAAPSVTVSRLEIGFFDEAGARELIDAYARAAAAADAAYFRHPGPARDLIDAYFESLEAALGLSAGDLWADERGRAFAGYAPVLAAIGSLLAEMDSFIEVTNRLRSGSRMEAWDVVDTVLGEILTRERTKLVERLAEQTSAEIPDAAYDTLEQLRLLALHAQGKPPAPSERIRLPEADLAKYYAMVDQYLPEHPFLRNDRLENAVLGAKVFAHAITSDLFSGGSMSLLDEQARQPFLWRFTAREVEADSILDGRYLGVLLDSYWSDPLTTVPFVALRSDAPGEVDAFIGAGAAAIKLKFIAPVEFLGTMRDCDVDIAERVVLRGQSVPGSEPTFYTLGTCRLICEQLEIAAQGVTVDGHAHFEAGSVVAPPQLSLRVLNGSALTVDGPLKTLYPWNRHAGPAELRAPTSVEACIAECARRFPDGAALTLNSDYSATDDQRMTWTARDYPVVFQRLIALLVEHGLALTEPMAASGAAKVRVRPQVAWSKLLAVMRKDEPATPEIERFLSDVLRP